WGLRINPSPRTVGITPTPESSSEVARMVFLWPQGQSSKQFVCLVSDQRVALPLHYLSAQCRPPARTSTTRLHEPVIRDTAPPSSDRPSDCPIATPS